MAWHKLKLCHILTGEDDKITFEHATLCSDCPKPVEGENKRDYLAFKWCKWYVNKYGYPTMENVTRLYLYVIKHKNVDMQNVILVLILLNTHPITRRSAPYCIEQLPLA